MHISGTRFSSIPGLGEKIMNDFMCIRYINNKMYTGELSKNLILFD